MSLVAASWYITGRKHYLCEPSVISRSGEQDEEGVKGSFDGKSSEEGQTIHV